MAERELDSSTRELELKEMKDNGEQCNIYYQAKDRTIKEMKDNGEQCNIY